MANNKGWTEQFSLFFEQPSRETLRDVLRETHGEYDWLDFKREWPGDTKGFHQLARHVLAMANSGGGCIVFGVEDSSCEAVGLDKIVDKADIKKKLKGFLPTQLQWDVHDFLYTGSEYEKIQGKKFQVVLVEDEPKYLPFISITDGETIKRAAIYVRRGTESSEASYEELHALLNRRLDTEYSSSNEMVLAQDLAILRTLYQSLEELEYDDSLSYEFPEVGSYWDFITNLISKKEDEIEACVMRTGSRLREAGSTSAKEVE